MDWVASNTGVRPSDLGPNAVRSVARMTLAQDLYAKLEHDGAMGSLDGKG